MTHRASTWLDRNTSVLASIAVIGTCLCFAGFAYLLVQNGHRAAEGSTARARQMQTFPVSVKVYEEAAVTLSRLHPGTVITQDDLTCFKTGRKCPPPRRTP